MKQFLWKYSKNVTSSLRHTLVGILTNAPRRIRRFNRHLTLAKMKLKEGYTTQKKLSSRVFIWTSGVWLGRVLCFMLDILGWAEWLDLFWQITKPNTRPMSLLETIEARKIFGDSLPYNKIRIDESSFIAHIGAWIHGARQMGVCTFYTINFTRQIKPAIGNQDMAWLIHELVHVAQMEHIGSRYMGESIYAQLTTGYHYGNPILLPQQSLRDFNREQQGDIIQHYYYHVLYKRWHNHYSFPRKVDYQPIIQDLRDGKLG